jgi:hypothetical protein
MSYPVAPEEQAPGVKIIEDATGAPPSAAPFLQYVTSKFAS